MEWKRKVGALTDCFNFAYLQINGPMNGQRAMTEFRHFTKFLLISWPTDARRNDSHFVYRIDITTSL